MSRNLEASNDFPQYKGLIWHVLSASNSPNYFCCPDDDVVVPHYAAIMARAFPGGDEGSITALHRSATSFSSSETLTPLRGTLIGSRYLPGFSSHDCQPHPPRASSLQARCLQYRESSKLYRCSKVKMDVMLSHANEGLVLA